MHLRVPSLAICYQVYRTKVYRVTGLCPGTLTAQVTDGKRNGWRMDPTSGPDARSESGCKSMGGRILHRSTRKRSSRDTSSGCASQSYGSRERRLRARLDDIGIVDRIGVGRRMRDIPSGRFMVSQEAGHSECAWRHLPTDDTAGVRLPKGRIRPVLRWERAQPLANQPVSEARGRVIVSGCGSGVHDARKGILCQGLGLGDSRRANIPCCKSLSKRNLEICSDALPRGHATCIRSQPPDS